MEFEQEKEKITSQHVELRSSTFSSAVPGCETQKMARKYKFPLPDQALNYSLKIRRQRYARSVYIFA